MVVRHPVPRQGQTVDFVQHIRTTVNEIWCALTTKEGLATWIHSVDANIPREPGQPFFITWEMRGAGGECKSSTDSGVVLAYEEPNYLALEWHMDNCEDPTYVSFHIQPSYYPYGTEYTQDTDLHLIHSGFPAVGRGAFEFDGAFRHWRQALGELAARLEGRPGKPTPYSLAGLMFVGGIAGTGLLIRDVVAGSPADLAGIQPGEILRAVDHRELGSLDDFHAWIDGQPSGVTGLFSLQDREVEVTIDDVHAVRALRDRAHTG
ncbi:MAG TPA: PDZ domain-containing protein [Streptosporangiaceae bacterium]|nr:PDZ domain-containing protein [Streptosporangiaceae bacterium]